ncbi:hypothetical protein PSEEN5349 [Pseudomonas entomophila L48]|uniref:Uncharacterized protein n=1 Tax=Pseudomonas entomophila (strain L48) TaxID=384676 RepID=Q1I320_PSEE4|nr:hypothetical protein PSEEN5349 [Pseudomonas entomophila L48]
MEWHLLIQGSQSRSPESDPKTLCLGHFPDNIEASARRVGYFRSQEWLKDLVSDSEKSHGTRQHKTSLWFVLERHLFTAYAILGLLCSPFATQGRSHMDCGKHEPHCKSVGASLAGDARQGRASIHK